MSLMNNITYYFPPEFYRLVALCEDVQQDGRASSSATSSSSQQPVQQQGGQSLQLNAVNVKPVPQPQPNKHARTHAERLMEGYRPGGTAIDNRNIQPAPNPPKPNGIIAFFMAFLRKANDMQIKLFKAMMDTPTAQTIKALLLIPNIPKMLQELRKQEAEEWNNANDRQLCEKLSKKYRITFYECLARINTEKAEQERKAQGIGPTQ
jgi:hypothetical protein